MSSVSAKSTRNSDFFLALGFVAILAVMVVPLPKFLLDIFLCLEIAIAVLMLLTSVYATRALDFSIFPSLLLMSTLFRLSLNIATTRIILLRGSEEGVAAAGEVIRSFGEFVVGGNYAVGVVIFIILVIINFVVITKGAGRVAEVAARFTLDAMPGKQMAIDADLNAGLINEEEARKRRSEIAREADFYGAMDGSSKFVRGDAIAGILIVIVNIVGGIAIGVLQKGLDFYTAASTFTLLTIGDGLVTQIPALIISTAAGVIVTRTATSVNFSTEVSRQLSMKPTALTAAAGVMGFLGLIPGLPFWPFFILCAGIGGIAWLLTNRIKLDEAKKTQTIQQEKLKSSTEKLENLLSVDILELEVGYGLINIVDSDQNGDLLDRIANIRKQFVMDLGVIIPPLRIRDNLELAPGDYQILLKGVVIGQGSLMVGSLLAMDPGTVSDPIVGIKTREPAFGLDALWIAPNQKEEAAYRGYTVVDLSTVIATHLTEVVRQNVSDLLGRQEIQGLLDTLKQTAPKVVEDCIPAVLPIGVVLKVLKNLLKENVPIRDLRTILEALSDFGTQQKDPILLTEHVRSVMSRVITKRIMAHAASPSELALITLDRSVEETLASSIVYTDQGPILSADPDYIRKFMTQMNQFVADMLARTNQSVVLCSPVIRYHLKNLLDRFLPNVVVISHNEISTNIKVQAFATIRGIDGR
jgi:flagellar biosynthesis protein FlhA